VSSGVVVALLLVLLSIPVLARAVEGAGPLAPAQSAFDSVEVSDSCIAIGEHVPNLTVWGVGFDAWVPAESTNFLSVEWSWGGAPSFPNPAVVLPLSRVSTTGSFTMTFDVTGVSQGFAGFSVVVRNPSGSSPTLVGSVDVDINDNCPTGTATCSITPGPGVLLMSVNGYDPTFPVQFFYQYRRTDQIGPVPGTAAPDSSVRGQFQPAPQTANATVTARIVQPAEGDSSSQTFFITFDAPACQDVAGPALLITPGVFDFGVVNLAASSGAVAFNVVNVGKLTTPISSIALGGGQSSDFKVDSNACDGVTLVAGAGCTVTIHFTPSGPGARTATLTATSSNSATASASLTGTGLRPPGLSINPSTRNFGSVPEHTASSPTTFTVANTGSQPQTITSVSLTGSQASEFVVDLGTCGGAVVVGGGTCTLQVVFQPSGLGSRTARLIITSNANASAAATLRGTGQAGRLGLDPSPADFGVVPIGTTANAIDVKVTNGGTAALAMSAVRTGGANASEFSIVSDSCTGQQLAPGGSCTVSVAFRPADAGDRIASLDIDNVDGTTSGVLRGAGIFQAILKFTPSVVSAGQLATVVGQSFPANTAITLQWQETGIHEPIEVKTDGTGGFKVSFVIIIGERLGPRHLEPAPAPGVLEEPRPIAPLLVQAPTFRPQGVAIRSGGFSPTLVSRG
jgi:hypothetical protein